MARERRHEETGSWVAEVRRGRAGGLLRRAEATGRGTIWEMAQDGFERWLGPIHRAA